jgi:hypothetical protein
MGPENMPLSYVSFLFREKKEKRNSKVYWHICIDSVNTYSKRDS